MSADMGNATQAAANQGEKRMARWGPGAPIAALLGTLLVAYSFDRWLETARSLAAAYVSVDTYQWVILVANLAFAACILGCGWTLLRSGPSRMVAVLYLIVGSVIVLLPTPPFWGFGAQVPSRLVPVLQASPHSLFGEAGAFLVVLGVAGLVWPRRSS